MNYAVVIQPRALRELDAQYQHIAESSPQTAAKWLKGFRAALQGLATQPERCAIAGEFRKFHVPVRQLLYGKRAGVRRALFVIEGETVQVLAIRHAMRDEATWLDLFGD